MKNIIKFSQRDHEAPGESTSIWNNQSQVEQSYPKKKIDINIKLDPERSEIEKNISMNLNTRNHMNIAK